MRELIDLITHLTEASEVGGDGVKAKGLYPDELKKRDNFQRFIQKILHKEPFIDHSTGEEVIVDPNEAGRMQKLMKSGDFKGKLVTIKLQSPEAKTINLGQLRKTEEFGGSTKENLKLKPSNIGITDKDIPASDFYETIINNPVLQSTDYGQVVIQLAGYIVSGEYVQLPPEYTEKSKEADRKAIVDYAGEYLGVLALLYDRSRFPRKAQFVEWLGTDIGALTLNFPSAANNNIADSYAMITNPETSHSLNISSKGTGGGAAPAISGLKLSESIKKNPKLANAVKLIELCQSKSTSGPSTIVQAFEIMDLIFQANPKSLDKKWHKFLPFSVKKPKLMREVIDSINTGDNLPYVAIQEIISSVKSATATDGGKFVYLMKKEIAEAINKRDAIPEFKNTVLEILEMNFIQQYTDYQANGELKFATQWPAKLNGVVTVENKSSATEPSSAGFSFKLGRSASDYEVPEPDGDPSVAIGAPDVDDSQLVAKAAELTGGPAAKVKPKVSPEVGNVGRKKR